MIDRDLSEIDLGHPPPRKEDSLFPHYSTDEPHVDMRPFAGWDWIYSKGFRRAAQHLTKQVSDDGTHQHFLFYPIAYLYRHHVEIVLKAIIKSAFQLLDHEATEADVKILGSHDLVKLWQKAQPLFSPICQLADESPFPDADIEWVSSYIDQLHKHDPDGQRFRYGTTKANAPSLNPNLKTDHVMVLAIGMENLANFLEGIEGWFVELEEEKARV